MLNLKFENPKDFLDRVDSHIAGQEAGGETVTAFCDLQNLLAANVLKAKLDKDLNELVLSLHIIPD